MNKPGRPRGSTSPYTKSIMLAVRMHPGVKTMLIRLAKKTGMSQSNLISQWILNAYKSIDD